MAIGLGLTKVIDITCLYHLIPNFLFLSLVQGITTHISTKIVDEIYLNNQRANMLFDDFLKKGKFTNCADINNKEIYCLPDMLNP